MKRARMQLDLHLLAQALYLPDGVMIERVIADPYRFHPHACELVITGEALPVPTSVEGELIPEIDALMIRDDDFLTGMPRIKVQFRLQGDTPSDHASQGS
jgi:hypothetical protein